MRQRFFSATLQNFATQSLLMAVGVGARKALAASAAINWMLKDGMNRLVRMSVATQFGDSFDSDLKVGRPQQRCQLLWLHVSRHACTAPHSSARSSARLTPPLPLPRRATHAALPLHHERAVHGVRVVRVPHAPLPVALPAAGGGVQRRPRRGPHHLCVDTARVPAGAVRERQHGRPRLQDAGAAGGAAAQQAAHRVPRARAHAAAMPDCMRAAALLPPPFLLRISRAAR